MKPRREHFVTFMSPGTLFAESTQKPIQTWDAKEALARAERIRERYSVRPYGFQFQTKIVADPIPDGEGGTLEVTPKRVATSGTYYIGGTLRTIDEVDQKSILGFNMRNSGCSIVVEVTNGYSSTHVFAPEDVIINATGEIVERGDDQKRVAYRKAVDERIAAEYAK